MDALPIFSQTKSLVQLVCGQKDEARKTQENFSRQCPVISQCRSFGEWIKGDNAAAKETQKECGRFLISLTDGLPIIGHIKGGIHYGLGDKLAGENALKAASHTSAVMAGGVAGFVVGGPVGACAVAAASGAAYDSTVTAVDSAIHKEFKPYGVLQPLKQPKNAGLWCDAVGGVVIDGMVGRGVGKLANTIKAKKLAVTAVSAETVSASAGATAFIPNVSLFMKKNGYVLLQMKRGILYLSKDKTFIQIKNSVIKYIMEKLKCMQESKSAPVQTASSKRKASSNLNQEKIEKENVLEFRVNNGVMEIYMNGKLSIIIKDKKAYEVSENETLVELKDSEQYNLNENGDFSRIRDDQFTEAINESSLIEELAQPQCGPLYAVADHHSGSFPAFTPRCQDLDLRIKHEMACFDNTPVLKPVITKKNKSWVKLHDGEFHILDESRELPAV